MSHRFQGFQAQFEEEQAQFNEERGILVKAGKKKKTARKRREAELQTINVKLARQQLESSQQLSDFQQQQFEASQPLFERFEQEQALFDEAFPQEERIAALRAQQEHDQFLRETARAEIEQGGRATPEQRRLIEQLTSQTIARGGSDIERFQQRGLNLLGEELAPSLGLRAGDTPILDRGGRVLEEGNRQFGQLVRSARGAQATAELNFPLGQSQLRSSQIGAQQGVSQAAAQFQADLRNQAFSNRLAQLQQTSDVGLRLTGAPFSSSGALDVLQQQSLARINAKAQSGGGFLDTISGVSSVASGTGGFLEGIAAVCWVAAEYFGWYTPDWHAARRWIVEGWRGPEADHFRYLYFKNGPIWAEMVRVNPNLKEALRPLFVWARNQGA